MGSYHHHLHQLPSACLCAGGHWGLPPSGQSLIRLCADPPFTCCKGGATAFFPQVIPGDQMVAVIILSRRELGSSWLSVATGPSGGNTLGPAKVHRYECR